MAFWSYGAEPLPITLPHKRILLDLSNHMIVQEDVGKNSLFIRGSWVQCLTKMTAFIPAMPLSVKHWWKSLLLTWLPNVATSRISWPRARRTDAKAEIAFETYDPSLLSLTRTLERMRGNWWKIWDYPTSRFASIRIRAVTLDLKQWAC